MEKVFCADCGKECKSDGFGTGYGIERSTNKKICYDCCAKRDLEELNSLEIGKGRVIQYLNWRTNEVTNWPGTMRFKVVCKEGFHNIARVQRNVWFSYKGKRFHGVQYGNDSEICYIKRVKNSQGE